MIISFLGCKLKIHANWHGSLVFNYLIQVTEKGGVGFEV